MARSRQRRHETAFAVVIMTIAAAAYSIYSIVHHDWNSALWAGCVAVAVPCWLFAIKAPSTCGVTTKAGRPCANRSYGVLFGCGSAEGHTWAKFFAHFGWHRRPPQPRSPSPITTAGSDRALRQETKSPSDQRDVRDNLVFWAAMVATVAGVASAATDLAGILQR